MELRQLRYYVTAARTLNFSQAAQQLAISQSTLSQQIQQLEAELGVQLFRRNSHSVLLTEEGRELLSSAVDALSAAQACKERLADIKGL
ncbi:LysR family transcriptional regulator, partial [uncultured Muribaculum sp.]